MLVGFGSNWRYGSSSKICLDTDSNLLILYRLSTLTMPVYWVGPYYANLTPMSDLQRMTCKICQQSWAGKSHVDHFNYT